MPAWMMCGSRLSNLKEVHMNVTQIVRLHKYTAKQNNQKKDYLDHVMHSSLAENTRLAYHKGWQCFTGYCHQNRFSPLPAKPEHVAKFLIYLATEPSPASGKFLSMGSIDLYSCAINKYHHEQNIVSPTSHPLVKNTLKGLSRIKHDQPRKVKALREYQISTIINRCPETPIGIRDASVLSLGFAAALRRSEICQLELCDVEFLKQTTKKDRMLLRIKRSKTDQAGRGYKIAIVDGIRIKPVTALKKWLEISDVKDSYLFRAMKRNGKIKPTPLHHSDIPRLIKQHVAKIGLDPTDYAGHSLRAGFITSAVANHARLDKIMDISRHKNTDTVMGYIRDQDVFKDHAGAKFL